MTATVLWIRSNRALAAILGLAGLALALFIGWQVAVLVGAHRERGRQQAVEAVAMAKAVQRDSAAKEAAAAQRRTDDAAVASQTKELSDALASLPDRVPDGRRLALACARLRQQGVDVSGVPACG
jgi:uncharacterized protein HemX